MKSLEIPNELQVSIVYVILYDVSFEEESSEEELTSKSYSFSNDFQSSSSGNLNNREIFSRREREEREERDEEVVLEDKVRSR